MTYVERILERLGREAVRAGDPVVGRRSDRRRRHGPNSCRPSDTFDAVVLATHADDALGLLRDADIRERAALGGFNYSTNRVVLHTEPPSCPVGRPHGHPGTSTRRTIDDPATSSR